MDSIETLYEKYSQMIYYYVLGISHNEYEAEDIVQDVMVEVMDHPGCLDGRAEPQVRGFLLTIAKNRCYDSMRRVEKKNASYEEIREMCCQKRQTEYCLPEEHVLGQDLENVLSQGLCGLKPENRLVMDYRVRYAMNSKEIAAKLHLSPATVDKRISRGRQELKRVLGRAGYYL